MRQMTTKFLRKKDIKPNWFLIDAENVIVGRLAAFISLLIRGKNKGKSCIRPCVIGFYKCSAHTI